MRLKNVWVGLICSVLMSAPILSTPSLAGPCPAEGLVKSAANAFRNASSAQGFANAASRFADMRSLSLFALGPYRAKLPKGTEGKYLALSKAFMGKFMAQYANRIAGSKLIITACSPTSVSAKFEGGSSLVFRVSGSSRISDVSVAGFSIANAMRNKFTTVINNNGGDIGALLTYLAN